MTNVALLARRELAAFLKTPMGYIIVAIVLFLDGLFFNVLAIGGSPKLSSQVLQQFFAIATFFSMVAGIVLTMRQFAEEKQLGTMTLLLTSPIREHEIVLGKFLAALLFFLAMTLLTIHMPLLIFVHGKVSVGHIVAGYLGLLMVGMMSVAVGLFASSLTRLQIVAVVIGASILTAIYLCWQGARVAEPPIRDLMAYLSQMKHLAWQNGVIHLRDVVYFLSMTYFFLLLTVQVLRARRWR